MPNTIEQCQQKDKASMANLSFARMYAIDTGGLNLREMCKLATFSCFVGI